MSQENVEVVCRMYEAFLRGDQSAIVAGLHPEIEWRSIEDTQTRHGHEGLRRAWAQFREPWETFENDMEWTRDAGNEVVSCHRVRARGKGSGIAGELHYAYVFRFREGKIVHVKSYGEPSEALEAVGLSA